MNGGGLPGAGRPQQSTGEQCPPVHSPRGPVDYCHVGFALSLRLLNPWVRADSKDCKSSCQKRRYGWPTRDRPPLNPWGRGYRRCSRPRQSMGDSFVGTHDMARIPAEAKPHQGIEHTLGFPVVFCPALDIKHKRSAIFNALIPRSQSPGAQISPLPSNTQPVQVPSVRGSTSSP